MLLSRKIAVSKYFAINIFPVLFPFCDLVKGLFDDTAVPILIGELEGLYKKSS